MSNVAVQMVYREREARQKAESDRDAAIKRAIEADADREHVREQFESVCSQLHDAQRDRDDALSAMWSLICVATEIDSLVERQYDAIHEDAAKRIFEPVSLQARDGH